MPVSAVISPIKQKTLDDLSFFSFKDIAVPTAIGKTPPTMADEKILCFGKQREIDLKAMEEERKIKEDEARINLDKTKFLKGQQIAEEKLEQNEELAHLRADTAIEKSLISADVKLTSDKMKAKDVRTLKGPRS